MPNSNALHMVCSRQAGATNSRITPHQPDLHPSWDMVLNNLCTRAVLLLPLLPKGLAITTSPAAAAKTSMQERGLGPLDSRKAHNGAVTCILPTQDGLHLLTAGNDDRMQLWNATHLHSQIVNYPHARNRARKARQCALTDDSRILFFPSGNGVQVYETLTGKLITSLAHGHYDAVNCCAYNADLEELYTGANDNRILAWHVAAAGLDFDDAADADNAEQDDWGD